MEDVHTHECPACGRHFECSEGGWHGIDYRWFVRCEDCLRKAQEEAAAQKASEPAATEATAS